MAGLPHFVVDRSESGVERRRVLLTAALALMTILFFASMLAR